MRFVIVLALSGLAIAYFGHKASIALTSGHKSPQASVAKVNDILDRVAAGKPLDGRPAPDKRWISRMTTACARREDRLRRVPRSSTPSGIAARSEMIRQIERAYAGRIWALPVPAAYRTEIRRIRALTRAQDRALGRVAVAARGGGLGAAVRASFTLRELAGRVNVLYLQLGLGPCAVGTSAMPL